ncbi:hypothetical protein HK405_004652, partial [Cladochytrium tenue]
MKEQPNYPPSTGPVRFDDFGALREKDAAQRFYTSPAPPAYFAPPKVAITDPSVPVAHLQRSKAQTRTSPVPNFGVPSNQRFPPGGFSDEFSAPIGFDSIGEPPPSATLDSDKAPHEMLIRQRRAKQAEKTTEQYASFGVQPARIEPVEVSPVWPSAPEIPEETVQPLQPDMIAQIESIFKELQAAAAAAGTMATELGPSVQSGFGEPSTPFRPMQDDTANVIEPCESMLTDTILPSPAPIMVDDDPELRPSKADDATQMLPTPSFARQQRMAQPKHGATVIQHFLSSPASFARLVPHLDDLVMALDPCTRILYASPSCARFFADADLVKQNRGSLVNIRFAALVYPHDAPILEQTVREGFKDRKGYTVHVRVSTTAPVDIYPQPQPQQGTISPKQPSTRGRTTVPDPLPDHAAGRRELQLLELIGYPVLRDALPEPPPPGAPVPVPVYVLQIGRAYRTKGSMAADAVWASTLENLRLRRRLESVLASRGISAASHPLLREVVGFGPAVALPVAPSSSAAATTTSSSPASSFSNSAAPSPTPPAPPLALAGGALNSLVQLDGGCAPDAPVPRANTASPQTHISASPPPSARPTVKRTVSPDPDELAVRPHMLLASSPPQPVGSFGDLLASPLPPPPLTPLWRQQERPPQPQPPPQQRQWQGKNPATISVVTAASSIPALPPPPPSSPFPGPHYSPLGASSGAAQVLAARQIAIATLSSRNRHLVASGLARTPSSASSSSLSSTVVAAAGTAQPTAAAAGPTAVVAAAVASSPASTADASTERRLKKK